MLCVQVSRRFVSVRGHYSPVPYALPPRPALSPSVRKLGARACETDLGSSVGPRKPSAGDKSKVLSRLFNAAQADKDRLGLREVYVDFTVRPAWFWHFYCTTLLEFDRAPQRGTRQP